MKLYPACVCLGLLLIACSFTRSPLPLPASFHAMESAVEPGPAHSAFLGLQVELNQPVDVFSLDMPPGIRVIGVEEGGPAANAGVQIGDILLAFDGQATDDPQRLVTLLEGIPEQRSVVLSLQRGSEVLETDAALEVFNRSNMRRVYSIDRGLLRAAFRDDARGFPQVVEFAPESPLAAEGMRKGDSILRFQGQDPGSSAEFVRRARLSLRPGDLIQMEVRGLKGSQRTLKIHAWNPGTALTDIGLWPLFSWRREIGRDHGEFRLGLLFITNLFRYSRDGEEREYSILSLLHWKTGELVLEDSLDQSTESRP